MLTDEAFSIYRWRHFVTVHKIIGFKPGTGGSAGVGWLQQVTNHKFFPELWEIRDELWRGLCANFISDGRMGEGRAGKRPGEAWLPCAMTFLPHAGHAALPPLPQVWR